MSNIFSANPYPPYNSSEPSPVNTTFSYLLIAAMNLNPLINPGSAIGSGSFSNIYNASSSDALLISIILLFALICFAYFIAFITSSSFLLSSLHVYRLMFLSALIASYATIEESNPPLNKTPQLHRLAYFL